MAKKAAKWHHALLEPITASDLIDTLRKYISQDWNTNWKSLPENNKLRHIKPVPSPWKPPTPNSRKLEIYLCRLCIGHTYPTNAHLLTNQPASACSHCGNLISVKHIPAKCTFYDRFRWKLSSQNLTKTSFSQLIPTKS